MGGETLNTVIGQGHLLCTPMQLAVVAARIASGRKVVPNIMFDDTVDREFDEITMKNPNSLDVVRSGMIAMFNASYGNGYRNRISTPGMEFAGKTGTMQIVSRRIKAKDMLDNKVSDKLKTHGIFIGYAPIHNPKYAVSTVIERGIWGASSAAPVARKILMAAMGI